MDSPSPSLVWRGQLLGWLCLAVLVVFTWFPRSYYVMLAWPLFPIWLVGFLVLGLWAIWMLRQFKLPFKPLGYGLDWPIALGSIVLILSAVFAEFKEVAFWNVSIAFCYVILLYVLRNWLEKGGLTLQRLWIGVCIVGIVSSLISIGTWPLQLQAGGDRNYLPMGHPNFVAGYVLLVLPLTVCLGLSRKGWQRITLLASSSILAIVLYTTGSRGGYVGFLVAILVAIGFFIFQEKGKQRWLRIGICSVLLSLILIIALNNPRVQQIVKVSPTANSQPVELKIDGQTEDRLFMLQTTKNIFLKNPVFGVGAGNMSRVYNLYRPLEVGLGASAVQQLHNTYAQVVGELGLVGLSTFFFLIFCLCRLWFSLYQKLSDRWLLYGIGSSFLGYGALAFTDYQLENIGISSTLVLLVVFLVGLADAHKLSQPESFNYFSRRYLSLGVITVGIFMLLLWIPVTSAIAISSTSVRNLQTGNIDKAYEKSSLAANLVTWDPIYNLVAGFQLLRVRDPVEDTDLFNELTEIALSHFQKGLDAAPYDSAFNQNLGILYRGAGNSDRAAFYFSRSIQLLPRNNQYTYYLLGREYLKQQKIDKAIAAFSLQGLIYPEFLTSDIWSQSPLSSLKEPVLQATLNLLQELLNKLSVEDTNYDRIYEKLVVLKWWHQKPLKNLEIKRLRPVVRSLLLAETSPQSALKIINDNIDSSGDRDALLLLRAWINPQQYLTAYLQTNSAASLNPTVQKLLEENIYQQRNLRDWLSSLKQNSNNINRNALILTYRNFQSPQAAKILLPQEVTTNFVVQLLNLFTPFPRVITPLDRLIDEVKTEKLNLPHPSKNGFKID
ncbi:MAG: O-antigen ligase family protein [Prochloraceae cyanobacterium]|nr:O-antigen ligase family protein [Prochloraceae cyanobacterium]